MATTLFCHLCGATIDIRNCEGCKHYVCQACSGIWRETPYGLWWVFHEAWCKPCMAQGRHLDPLYGVALPFAEFGL